MTPEEEIRKMFVAFYADGFSQRICNDQNRLSWYEKFPHPATIMGKDLFYDDMMDEQLYGEVQLEETSRMMKNCS